MVKTLGELYQQYEVTREEEEAWNMKQKTDAYTDYAAPLLEMKRMLAQYEQVLIAKRWEDAVALAPMMNAQMRLLTQTVRVQSEEQRL